MSKMTWKAFVPKKPNRRLMKKKTVITAVAGISAANDSTVHIYAFVEKKGWVIKMPAGVPPTVVESFAALIPYLLS